MTTPTDAEATSAVSYSQIPHIPRRWLWQGHFPIGTPCVYAAAGGTGKGLLMAAGAARVTLGLPFPGDDQDARRDPGRVIWITGPGEDDQMADLAPRLRAAIASAAAEFGLGPAECAAALARVYDLSEWADGTPVSLPADCAALADQVAALNSDGGPRIAMVVADSLSALLSDGFTVDSRQGARRVMGRLARFAQAADVAFPVLHHLTKDGKVAGSPAVLAGVRVAFTIERDPDRAGVRTITEHKANASSAAPQQFVIAGSGPDVHAVFTTAAAGRAERIQQASQRAGGPSAGSADRSNPTSFRARMARSAVPGGHRCLKRAQREGAPPRPGELLADGVTPDAARAAAVADAGCALTWQTAPSGMDVATVARPDGWRVSYGVYPSKAP